MTLLAALAALAALPSHSAAATHRATPSATAPANAGTISDSLKRQTGYSASELTSKPVCGAPRPGQLSCLARILIVKSTGKPAGLLRAPHASPMQVTRSGSLAAAMLSADQTGTAAPQSGTAAFLQWAYDTTWLSANRGSDDTVAIIDAYDDPNAAADLATFRSTNGLSTCTVGTCFNQYNEGGQLIDQPGATGTAPKQDATGGWEVEESLDLDAVSSLCPDCKIDMVEARTANGSDLESAAQVAHALGASQISMSFGGDEPAGSDPETAGTWTFSGVASLAAAGDSSYPGPQLAGDTNTVGYPAAYPDVTAVGGTSLAAGSAPRGFDESTWSIGTCLGGSTCGTESGCDTSQTTPSYQQGDSALIDACAQIAATADVPNEGGRAYNDVSADADPNTGLNVEDTIGGSQGCSTWCIVGGTSLSTPLTAAYEAVASLPRTPSPAWAYTDTSLLNDIVSGSDGTCPSGALLICNAGTGWDGPTGNGSINGDVVTGGPGVGGGLVSVDNADDAAVGGGVYPNGAATTYSVQYATDTYYTENSAYNEQTTASSAGSGSAVQSVSSPLCGLTPNTTYDYSVAATNSYGTTVGYDNTFTTAATEAPPANITPPSITGTAMVGQTLTAQRGTWDACSPAPSYQWQASRSGASGTWSDIPSATAATFTPDAADTGMYITVAVTESNSSGGTTATASPVGPVRALPPTIKPAKKPPTKPGASSTKTVRFYRCARTCTLLDTHGAITYKPQRADDGRYIKVVTTFTRTKGKAPTVTTRWIGPITAATAGDVTLGGAAHVASTLTVKGSTQKALARVRVKKRASRTLTLAVTRRGRIATSVWAYVISNGAVVSCTRSHSLARPVTLSVTASRSETVKLVAVRA